jgi:hypothetical protein
MTDQNSREAANLTSVQAELHEAAESLRKADHLRPALQKELADLLDEISRTVASTGPASPDLLQLGRSAMELARHLHQQHKGGRLAAVKEQLQRALARVEMESPQLAALAQPIIDALVNMGI